MSTVEPDDPHGGSAASSSAEKHYDPRLEPLLEAIAHRRPVDWAEARRKYDLSDAQVREFQVLAAIAGANPGFDLEVSAAARSLGHVLSAASTQAPADLATAGTPWGPLRRLEWLGGGHFGDVYRAYYPELEKIVALKIPKASMTAAARHSAAADARLLARIRHPNVVTVHGAAVVDGTLGVWMDFIQGRTLDQIVRSDGQFSGEEAMTIGECLCEALAAAHSQGVLHRDVKAENVMREKGGKFVLLDFGIGLDVMDATMAAAAGTPLYMAPELFRGAPASVQSDIYSLGVLLFYLVTSTYPVTGATYEEVKAKHAQRRRVRLADVRSGLPRRFVRIVEKAAAHDPVDRYASVGEMLADFDVVPDAPAQWWRMPLTGALAVLVLASGPYLLGQFSTRVYNVALQRRPPFGEETVVAAWVVGLRLLVEPLVFALVLVLAYRAVINLCRPLTLLPPARDGSSLARAIRLCRAGPRFLATRTPQALADLLLFTQVAATVAACWLSWDVVNAALSRLNDTEPGLLAPLRYGGLAKHGYQLSLCVVLLASISAWSRLLARHGIRQVGVVNSVVGMGMIALLLALLALPWRLIYDNTAERATYQGMRCYVTDRLPGSYLLYCPGAPPGRKVRTVGNVPELILTGEYESIFTPADNDEERTPR